MSVKILQTSVGWDCNLSISKSNESLQLQNTQDMKKKAKYAGKIHKRKCVTTKDIAFLCKAYILAVDFLNSQGEGRNCVPAGLSFL